MAEVAIALPFSIDAYGKVASTNDQKKIWADRVRSVIGTALRERVMQPLFGTEIPFTVFESSTEAENTIETTVQQSFEQQLPLLRLQEVTTTTDPYTNALNIAIIYALPNQDMVETTLDIISILGTTPINEEKP